ncbi:chorismate-binding protein [Aquirufa aurantiipilula]|uniref:chorismate-binding protein n=1 Tax=Aquirufa aurantiipilula TaxID=2696561 RepID=UPI001CAA43A9|nr:chorismate-binding protein [Aquirufa aurantiipilula]MBZ1326104.1 chorismate-binding protein [Aquirufa aurantiipilula]
MPSTLSSTLTSLLDWEQLWQHTQQKRGGMAVWRLPKSDKRYFLVDSTGGEKLGSLDLETFPAGFLVAPFIGLPYFLKAETLLEESIVPKEIEGASLLKTQHNVEENEQKHQHFTHWVNESIQEIQSGHFQKVVLSRTDEVEFPADFSPLRAFGQLCQAYPNAFVCALYIPELGSTWLCATPETLVEQDAQGIFRTIALAGTQSAIDPQGEIIPPQNARWSQKEIEEQAYVCRYIIECFKKTRLREYQEIGPKTILAGNLLHLKTEFTVDTKALNFSQLPGILLSLLHPTSAVCGTPKEEAIAWIGQAEKHARELYSGYLGPVNLGDEIHLFVNLRTVKVDQSEGKCLATYFAGCGITEDSDPEKEWHETVMKCQTLQRVLEN